MTTISPEELKKRLGIQPEKGIAHSLQQTTCINSVPTYIGAKEPQEDCGCSLWLNSKNGCTYYKSPDGWKNIALLWA